MILNYHFLSMIPNIKGITEVQRKGKKAFQELFDSSKNKEAIYLADRNKIFAVVLSVSQYENLTKNSVQETNDWTKASESSLEFWKDPSNDAYDKLA